MTRTDSRRSGSKRSGSKRSGMSWPVTLRPSTSRLWSSLVTACALLSAPRAQADVPVSELFRAAETLPDGGEAFLREAGPGGELLVRVDSRAAAIEMGLEPVTQHWAVAHGKTPGQWQRMARGRQATALWSPAKHIQLDRAAAQIQLETARQDFGVDGSGVVVGIIDTGIDVSHPAVRNEDGSTRIKWLLSYGEPPAELHPELERKYGCARSDDCAVYSASDIDAALEAEAANLFAPDDIGHGTHITSIAAGSDSDFAGVAPAADLVLVQAAGQTGSVSDARILTGSQFIFDRATENDQPAVVNVSLGSSFGAHDGSSALEQALTELARGPGRAIVVASGNDGTLFESVANDVADPIGHHTEVYVPPGQRVSVPFFTPHSGSEIASGGIFVWVQSSANARMQAAFDNGLGKKTPLVASGVTVALTSEMLGDPGDYELFIANGDDSELDIGIGEGSIVLGLVGNWEPGRVFELELRGEGIAKFWAQGSGDFGSQGGLGVVFPRARASGTVTIPATAPDLISVGASVNRNAWTDFTDTEIEFELGPIGERTSFSGAGPNALGNLKPDIIAPGGNVAAAMSDASDPRQEESDRSQFSAASACPDSSECFVIDDRHGVASGTSMATPVVAGAVALLFQRDPELTMADARLLLRAGASPAKGVGSDRGLSGAGLLDIEASLRALDTQASEKTVEPTAKQTRIVLADGFVRPLQGNALQGVVLLRDDSGHPAGGFDESLLTVDAGPAVRARIEMRRPGLADLEIDAEPGAPSPVPLRVSYDGKVIAERDVFVDVDAHVTNYGVALGGGTCSLDRRAPANGGWLLAVLVAVASALRRRLFAPNQRFARRRRSLS